MNPETFDYNRISSEYNLRYEANSLRGIEDALRKIISIRKPESILEIGCGTARWLSALDNISCLKIGADNSSGMLRIAQSKKRSLNLICADADLLPFPDNRFDLIFCVNAIHHFRKKREFISSASKMLKKGGVLAIIGVDPRNEKDEWYVYNYFDGIYEKDLKRFPSSPEIIDWMDKAGLKRIDKIDLEHVVNNFVGKDLFKDPFLRKDQSSQLAGLSDKEYSEGIAKIEHAIEVNPAQNFRVNLTFSAFTGINPQ